MFSMDNLPIELIERIGKHMYTKLDVSRFRGVCRSWRSSIPPFQFKLPITVSISSYQFALKEFVLYHSKQSDWWIEISSHDDNDSKILSPLIKNVVVNLVDSRVFELPRIYTLIWKKNKDYVIRSVAVSSDPSWPVLMMTEHARLYCFKLGNGGEIEKFKLELGRENFEHVIFYKDKFYVLSPWNGEVVSIDSSLNMEQVALPEPYLFAPNKCYLVESLGEILLVRRYWTNWSYCIQPKIEVYKLSSKKKWVEMRSLKGQILFVVDDDCFLSVSAQAFPGFDGNNICFVRQDNVLWICYDALYVP